MSKMAVLFDREHSTASHQRSIVTTGLSRTFPRYCEVLAENSRIFHTPPVLHVPVEGDPVRMSQRRKGLKLE